MDFNVQDLSGTFSVGDIAIALSLSFVLSAMIGWVYRMTHRNISYSQSYVQTLVILGMIISLIMLVVGSNIARAFALVGALSVIRFRNAIKETRDCKQCVGAHSPGSGRRVRPGPRYGRPPGRAARAAGAAEPGAMPGRERIATLPNHLRHFQRRPLDGAGVHGWPSATVSWQDQQIEQARRLLQPLRADVQVACRRIRPLWPSSLCTVTTSTPASSRCVANCAAACAWLPACSGLPRHPLHPALHGAGTAAAAWRPGTASAAADSNASSYAALPATATTRAPADPCVPCPGGRAPACGGLSMSLTCKWSNSPSRKPHAYAVWSMTRSRPGRAASRSRATSSGLSTHGSFRGFLP